jgi:hypothetical protein
MAPMMEAKRLGEDVGASSYCVISDVEIINPSDSFALELSPATSYPQIFISANSGI